jgi:hypothetical protein
MKCSRPLSAVGGLAAIVAVFVAGWLFGQGAAPAVASIVMIPSHRVTTPASIHVMLDFGDGRVKTVNDVALPANATVFDALKQMSDTQKISLDYKDYGGDLGVFVNAIDAVPAKPTSDKWWQFWVNGAYSDKGISSVHLKPGDVVEFKFIKGQMSQ